jgi:Fe-S oxidoreductase
VEGFQEPAFEIQHLTHFLVEHLEALRERMTSPIRRRVALHGHSGLPQVKENVKRLLAAIPELVTVEIEDGGELGYSCNVGGLLRLPDLQADVQAGIWQQARAVGADELVDLYHGCHRMLWDGKDGLKVRNFTDLLVEAIGLPAHEDRFQRYRGMPGIQQVLDAARDLMRENAVDPAAVERAFAGLFQR